MKKIAVFTILCFLAAPVMLLAQDNTESLDQISPEELQQLQDVINNIGESQSTTGETSYANDFNIDLVWKADTLIPFDYPGKALPETASRMHFYAIADFPNPEKLIYTWIIDDASSTRDGPELSGINESVFSMMTYRFPNHTHIIKLAVKDPETEKVATMTLEFETILPEAVFYWSINNNYGVASTETSRLSQGSENKLLARIFNINAYNFNDLNFKWFLNNSEEQNNNSRKEIMPINVSKESPPGSQAILRLEVMDSGLDETDFTQKATAKTTLYITKALTK